MRNVFLKALICNIACSFIYCARLIQRCKVTIVYFGSEYTYKGVFTDTFNISTLEDLANGIRSEAGKYMRPYTTTEDGEEISLSQVIKGRNFKIDKINLKYGGDDIDIEAIKGNEDIIVCIREVINIKRGAIVLSINGNRIESNEILDFYGSNLYEYLNDTHIMREDDEIIKWFNDFLKIIGPLCNIESDLSKCKLKDILDSKGKSHFNQGETTKQPTITDINTKDLAEDYINALPKGESITVELEGTEIEINVKPTNVKIPKTTDIKKQPIKTTGTGKDNNNSPATSGCSCR